MADWTFRITSEAAFCADLDGFCAQFGYPLLTVDDGSGGRALPGVIIPGSRFDFDVLELSSGLHVNARGSAVDGNTDALALIDTRIRSFFASLPTTTNTAPDPYTGTQVWHTTGNTVLIDPPPAYPKRVWA